MKKYVIIAYLLAFASVSSAQNHHPDSLKAYIGRSLSNIYLETLSRPTRVAIEKILINDRQKFIELQTNLALSYLPMREQTVQLIYDSVRYHLSAKQKKYQIAVITDGMEISLLVPNFFRNSQLDKDRMIAHNVSTPLVKNVSSPTGSFSKGLQNNHIALWQSHGWHYDQKLGRWEWQRARIFQTVEDLYTQSYVLPFLVPMLENAGANVLLPRERDYNKIEIIVDNDESIGGKSTYKETNGKEKWGNTGIAGFANLRKMCMDYENPFRMGTARAVRTISQGKESLATWNFDIPEKGKYGVYVSYQTLKNSSNDALYSVFHAGGKTDFRVNQQMGGGTWIFLGYFDFEKGSTQKITLSNKSSQDGKVVSADAVKIGGGMGNIARIPHPEYLAVESTSKTDTSKEKKSLASQINYTPQVSGYPRYAEGARYWMQWAGVPDTIYNRTEGMNDYTDDYVSRGVWVNWLAGGSSVLPKKEGLQIPVDLAFAFHSDAGTFWGDTIVGTLGIYMTHYNNEKFENGRSRWASRDLTELVMEEIVTDIRREFEPEWNRRQLWNRSYAEARIPNVPTMLLELLSHQNFADMRYGLDPTFRFTVSRSIYKGMLKFLATQYNRPYVVQPLPVKAFSAHFIGETQVKLSWQPTTDPAELSAKPDRYVIYTRMNGKGFDNGFVVHDNNVVLSIQKDSIYSFQVVAVNEGGRSFPSETLSICRRSNQKGEVLIVNGFTRVSAPFSFTTSQDSIAGFLGSVDNGVPYLVDHHFTGQMHEFRRVIPWMDDDAAGFGESNANYETTPIAGNAFDYPYTHGEAFATAGYSFVSTSAEAVENGSMNLKDYRIVDWILGKQREWSVARGAKPPKYKTFSQSQQLAITEFCKGGGKIIISGAFVGTDLWQNPHATLADRDWALQTLKFKWRNNNAAVTGQIKAVPSPFSAIQGNYNYYNELNSECYVVENPDALEPVDVNAFTIFRYTENNLSAGVLYKGAVYDTCILGFPIEAVKTQEKRNELIQRIMNVFD
jgi:hypothetical protein